MNKIYDNGALMIGNIDMVINQIKKDMQDNIDMVFTDQEELLQELLDLKNDNIGVDIVYINYERPMGYELNYWCKNDLVKVVD